MGVFRSRRPVQSSGLGTSPLSDELARILAFGRDQLNFGPVYPPFAERDLSRIIAEFQLDRRSVDSPGGASLEADYYQQAIADPEAFTRELAELVLPAGGLAVYGGARLAGSLLGWEYDGSHYRAMLEAAMEWKRGAGVSGLAGTSRPRT